VLKIKKKSMNSRCPKTNRTPIYRDTGFFLEDIPSMKKAFADELNYPRSPDLYIYSRYRNPNVVAAESMIMELEKSQWSVLTQSGLSAIDTALSIFQENDKNGKWLFFSEIYGGTNHFIDNVLVRRRGVEVVRFHPDSDMYNIQKFESILKEHKPKLVFFEAISNPMLISVDADLYIKVSKKYGAIVLVDNTFPTPFLWKPLESGADIVIHSVTKYLAGHGNISAGVLSGNDPSFLKSALEYRKLVGHMLSPDDAARLCDQLKTFELRMEKHCSNAFALANFLEDHKAVERVLYPGLESHPTHREAFKFFKGRGYGAIVTFDLAGRSNHEKANRCALFIEKLKNVIPLIPTLGDADTILMPIEPVWGDKFPFPGMIRLSVGIEDIGYLQEEIGKALEGNG
jgi:cystathionine beta-lyase/cystathionine gamma-synthase